MVGSRKLSARLHRLLIGSEPRHKKLHAAGSYDENARLMKMTSEAKSGKRPCNSFLNIFPEAEN